MQDRTQKKEVNIH